MSGLLEGYTIGSDLRDRFTAKKRKAEAAATQAIADEIEQKRYDQKRADRRAEIDSALAERKEQAALRERVDYAKMPVEQRAAYMQGQTPPVGIGVLTPENQTPEMRQYGDRMRGIEQDLDLVRQQKRQQMSDTVQQMAVADAMEQRRRRVAGQKPVSAVPVNTPPRVNRYSDPIGYADQIAAMEEEAANPATAPEKKAGLQRRLDLIKQAGRAMGAGVASDAADGFQVGRAARDRFRQSGAQGSVIRTPEEFDALPSGAPFIYNGKKGVKK